MAKIIGESKHVVQDDNGNLVFRHETIYGPGSDLENAVAAGDVTTDEQNEYMKSLIISTLHQELHDIFKAVQGYKQRAESVKKRLQALGVDTDNLLQKKIPPRPTPPGLMAKLQKQSAPTTPGNGNGNPTK